MTQAQRRARQALALTLSLIWLAACMGDTRPHVVIEFGAYPDVFEGLDVEIDGKVVGKLKKIGALTRTGFPIEKGEHSVRVVSDKYESMPVRLNADLKLQKIMLILEIGEAAGTDGRLKQVLTLHP